jgi:hypothetical protein
VDATADRVLIDGRTARGPGRAGAPSNKVVLAAVLAGAVLTLAACSGGSPSATTSTTAKAAPVTTTVPRAPSAPSKAPALTLSDNHRAIAVIIPATIRVSLPYNPSDRESWQLVTGGAGFAMIGSPTYTPPTTAGQDGTEVLGFLMTGHAPIRLTLVYAKPGTVPAKPKQRFSVSLSPS